MGTKIVIFGSRSFCTLPKKDHPLCKVEYDLVKLERAFKLLDELVNGRDVEIVCGLAEGADRVGYFYALARNLPLWQFPAQWDEHGNRAGMLRNADMRMVGDEFIGFWDLRSRGTMEMYRSVSKTNKPIKMYGYDFEPLGK